MNQKTQIHIINSHLQKSLIHSIQLTVILNISKLVSNYAMLSLRLSQKLDAGHINGY